MPLRVGPIRLGQTPHQLQRLPEQRQRSRLIALARQHFADFVADSGSFSSPISFLGFVRGESGEPVRHRIECQSGKVQPPQHTQAVGDVVQEPRNQRIPQSLVAVGMEKRGGMLQRAAQPGDRRAAARPENRGEPLVQP